jgi:hypothetical protein
MDNLCLLSTMRSLQNTYPPSYTLVSTALQTRTPNGRSASVLACLGAVVLFHLTTFVMATPSDFCDLEGLEG